jgi:outer membrane protein assembly factor BamB
MRSPWVVTLGLLAACSSGGSGGPPVDYAANFTGLWVGTVGGSLDGAPVTPTPGMTQVTRLGPNRLSLANVCPGGAAVTAQVSGPTSLVLDPTPCPPTAYVDCLAVALQITSGTGTILETPQGTVLRMDETGAMSGCGLTKSVRVAFDGTLRRGALGLASISPQSVMIGSQAFALSVQGGGFAPGAVVNWNGSPRPTTYLSPGELQAAIPATDVASRGIAQVTVSVPGSGTTASLPFEVTVPIPTVYSLVPPGVPRGSPALTLSVLGDGFQRGAVISFGGTARPTIFWSKNQIGVELSAADLTLPRTVDVQVILAQGGQSTPLPFEIRNPSPAVTSVDPPGAVTGDPLTSLTVTGSGFVPESRVRWAGSPRSTAFVSETELRADLAVTDLASPGDVEITVENPGPGGGVSPAVIFRVDHLPPVITAVLPDRAHAGQGGLTLTLRTQNALAGSEVRWNGAPRQTVAIGADLLEVFLGPDDLATPGGGLLTLHTPAPENGASAGAWLPIEAGPALTWDSVAWQAGPDHAGNPYAGSIFALPAQPTWTTALGQWVSYPLIAGNGVFVLTVGDPGGASGNYLQAVDLTTGVALWPPVVIQGPAALVGHAFDAGAVFVLRGDGQLFAFEAGTGVQRWSVTLAPGSAFNSTPVAAGGLVYVADATTIYAVDERDGQIVWTVADGTLGWSTPTVSDDGVYYGNNCRTSKYNRYTGTLLWRVERACFDGATIPVWSAGSLYVMDRSAFLGGSLYAAYDGALHRTLDYSLYAAGPPAVDQSGTVFLVNGAVQARDRDAAAIQWSGSGDAPLEQGPILVTGLVLVGSSVGTILALDRATGVEQWRASAGAVPYTVRQGPPGGIAAALETVVAPAGGQLTAWKSTLP